MPSIRKPQPKSQKEISNGLVDPYVSPETDQSLGNPNTQTEFNQFSANDQNGVDFNRSLQMSFKDDTTKPFTLGLQDIDESIMYYFQNVIRPTVIQNGVRTAVPVIYGAPERWKSVQKDGYYKDKNGAIMSPLIMFKRDTIDKNRSLTNKLDANSPNNIAVYGKRYSKQNAYSKFNILNGIKPEQTYYASVVPDYLTVTYDCIIFRGFDYFAIAARSYAKIYSINCSKFFCIFKIDMFQYIAISYPIFHSDILMLLCIIFVCFHNSNSCITSIIEWSVVSTTSKPIETINH